MILCEICKKNPAAIHIQELVNGKRRTLHLCLECAAKKSLLPPELRDFNLPEMLLELMRNNGNDSNTESESVRSAAQRRKTPGASDSKRQEEDARTCPDCAWTVKEWRKTGLLGCPHCYEAFDDLLDGQIAPEKGAPLHVGRIPAAFPPDQTEEEIPEEPDLFSFARTEGVFDADKDDSPHPRWRSRKVILHELDGLRAELDGSLRREEYMLAAHLRDCIRAIEKELAAVVASDHASSNGDRIRKERKGRSGFHAAGPIFADDEESDETPDFEESSGADGFDPDDSGSDSASFDPFDDETPEDGKSNDDENSAFPNKPEGGKRR